MQHLARGAHPAERNLQCLGIQHLTDQWKTSLLVGYVRGQRIEQGTSLEYKTENYI
jgi:hypothetical protein